MLAPIWQGQLSISIFSESAAMILSPTVCKCWFCATSLSNTTNSSPPIRNTVSDARKRWFIRCATSTSNASPTWCPQISFTDLKLSRSINIMANELLLRCACKMACSAIKLNCARLASPVRLSLWAISVSASSSCLRSVMSRISALSSIVRPSSLRLSCNSISASINALSARISCTSQRL